MDIGTLIAEALETDGVTSSVSIHGVDMSTAVRLATEVSGDRPQINQQASGTFVIVANYDGGSVSLFVR
jgi:hypothetical protein